MKNFQIYPKNNINIITNNNKNNSIIFSNKLNNCNTHLFSLPKENKSNKSLPLVDNDNKNNINNSLYELENNSKKRKSDKGLEYLL